MPCGACPSAKAAKQTYKHTASDDTIKVYSTETEARAAVARKGGSYTAQ